MDAPLYAMEAVVFGRKPIVAVLDLPGLEGTHQATTTGAGLVRQATATLPDLPRGDDPPAWYADCRSAHDVFCRPTPEERTTWCALHARLWPRVLDRVREAPRLTPRDAQAHREAQAAYKHHHAENSPGRPFLTRMRVAAWTEAMLDDVMFA